MIPIFEAKIANEKEGIELISFVENPAFQQNLLKFQKNNLYNIIDNVNHKVISPIVRANFPIYRNSQEIGEYYVVFSESEIEKIAKKMLIDGKLNNYTVEHNKNNKIEDIFILQLFIKNDEKGISPKNFENIENGSLFGVFEIKNEKIWEKVINNEPIGISLEGFFDLHKLKDEDIDYIQINELLNKIRKKLNN